MPIKPIVLQRRHAELGRIRLGHQTTTSNGRTRPAKLETFRFTSPSEQYIRDLAQLYGGTPQPWDNNGKAEFEVFTEAKSIPVIAVKGGMSQWLETWSGGGCVHRCDGETNVLTGEPCNPNDRAHVDAKPTTRLSVMLPELESVGVWRLESHGWNAAAELPAVAELAQYVGDLVPAHLNLVERRAIKDGKTSRFVVPVLDLQIGVGRLREIAAERSGSTAIESNAAGSRQAIGTGPAGEPMNTPPVDRPDYEGGLARATSRDEITAIWRHAKDNGFLTVELEAACTERATELAPPAQQQSDEPVDAVVVEDPPAEADPDAVWHQILAVAGDLGATESVVKADFEQHMALSPGEASAGELATYLAKLQQQGIDEQVPA